MIGKKSVTLTHKWKQILGLIVNSQEGLYIAQTHLTHSSLYNLMWNVSCGRECSGAPGSVPDVHCTKVSLYFLLLQLALILTLKTKSTSAWIMPWDINGSHLRERKKREQKGEKIIIFSLSLQWVWCWMLKGNYKKSFYKVKHSPIYHLLILVGNDTIMWLEE